MNTTLNLIILFLIISYIAVWGYAIYDVTKTKFKSKNNKIVWTTYDARLGTYLHDLGDCYSKYIPKEIAEYYCALNLCYNAI